MPPRGLSLLERKVVIGSRFAARESITVLAKRIGLRSHIVQRALRNLRERAILSPYVAVDVSKLGFTDYAVFFSVSPESAQMHQKLVQFLLQSVQVPWAVELVGEYQYAFSLICRHISEVDEFLLSLGKAVRIEMTNRTVLTRTSWTVFPPRYLLPDISDARPGYEIHSKDSTVKYDELDIQLLRIMSESSSPTDAECARTLGEAPATIRYRRNTLEKKGIIASYAFAVDCVSIGRFPCIFLLQVKSPHRDTQRRLRTFAANELDAVALVSSFGAWDYELSIEAESPNSIAEFQRRLLDRFSKELVAIRTLMPLKTHKLEPFPSGIGAARNKTRWPIPRLRPCSQASLDHFAARYLDNFFSARR